MKAPICAIITPPYPAAVGLIRCSGEGVFEKVARYFRPSAKLLEAPGYSIVYGTFYDDAGQPLDEILVSVFRAPHSYTGEDLLELGCHGNPELMARILAILLKDMSHAQAGEFTLRAYLNGKLDLSQAEAVNDLILAGSSKAASAALMQVKGYLRRHLEELLSRISEARLRCELAIDFADQDLPPLDANELISLVQGILADCKALYAEGQDSRKLREGVHICLAGAPNSGKSSLFNSFLKENRAIVSPVPGTTRDYLSEAFSLSGYPIVLYDTAGLRDSAQSIEIEGIRRTQNLMQSADLILYLYEKDFAPEAFEYQELAHKCIFVAAKSDLRDGSLLPSGHIAANSIHPDGLKELSAQIISRLNLPSEILDRPLVTNARHLAALSRAIPALQDALQGLQNGIGWEFIAFDLSAASSALEDILGIISSDALLGQIFSNFCIGK